MGISRLWNSFLDQVAIQPVWALLFSVPISGLGGGAVTLYWWLNGSWLREQPGELITLYVLGIFAIFMLLTTLPVLVSSRNLLRRRTYLSGELRRLVESAHGMKDDSPEHKRWEMRVGSALKKFDPVWADEFYVMRYRKLPNESESIIDRQIGKLAGHFLELRRYR